MGIIQHSQEAEKDLDEIWDYLATRNLDAAEDFLICLESIANLLSDYPKLGTACDSLAPNLCAMLLKGFSYVLYYLPTEEGISIACVLHGVRNIPELFQDDSQ